MVKMGWSKLRTCALSSSDSSTTPYSGTVKTSFLTASVAACLDGVGFLVIDKRVVAQLALDNMYLAACIHLDLKVEGVALRCAQQPTGHATEASTRRWSL